ncbi:hypothetical protein MKQ70_01020 [Chitinophaga sedimenti]|uniref:hypothetical protein n=1 Tax=Chitinophaga sedimenti TaxID=2033606 RepID=UPI002006254F|nr:hypothetical protein [Chitinophaga sedimenti]MCK7553656.1 hypothetical protein [Chitinophaga sedimenti]
MEQTIITIYIDEVPYRFNVFVDHNEKTTTYHVSAKDMGNGALEAEIPREIAFNVDGKVEIEAGQLTVKQEQTARKIWQEILRKLGR